MIFYRRSREELESWIAGSKAKLSNSKFVDGAPVEIVESAREHLAELESKLVSVLETLKVFIV